MPSERLHNFQSQIKNQICSSEIKGHIPHPEQWLSIWWFYTINSPWNQAKHSAHHLQKISIMKQNVGIQSFWHAHKRKYYDLWSVSLHNNQEIQSTFHACTFMKQIQRKIKLFQLCQKVSSNLNFSSLTCDMQNLIFVDQHYGKNGLFLMDLMLTCL